MRGHGYMLTPTGKSPIGSHADVLVEDLGGGVCEARLHPSVDERIWHAVVVLLDLDVTVDVDPASLQVPDLVALRGMRRRHRTIELFEESAGRFRIEVGAGAEDSDKKLDFIDLSGRLSENATKWEQIRICSRFYRIQSSRCFLGACITAEYAVNRRMRPLSSGSNRTTVVRGSSSNAGRCPSLVRGIGERSTS